MRENRSLRHKQVAALLQANVSKPPDIAKQLGIGLDYARQLKREVLSQNK